jgi:hypothetical protein
MASAPASILARRAASRSRQSASNLAPTTNLPYGSSGQDPYDPYDNPADSGMAVQSATPSSTSAAPPEGFNPADPTAFPVSPSSLSTTSRGGASDSYLPSSNPNSLLQYGMGNAIAQGQNLENQFGGQQQLYGNQEEQNYQAANDLYNPANSPILGDTAAGGLPTEAENQNLGFTAQDASQNFLTPGQQAAITGNPNAPLTTANALNYDTDVAIGGANQTAQNINTAGAQTLSGDVNNMAQGYGGAINTAENLEGGALQQGGTALGAATSNPGLAVSNQYLQQAGMTDAQVAETAALGAEASGAGYQTEEDQLAQAAAASGETNPMAVTAMQNQLRQESGAAQSDAAVQAQLQAQTAQRTAAQNVQSTQLGAAQYQTGAELTAAQEQEQAGIGIGQNISGEQLTAAGDVGLANIGTGEYEQGSSEAANTQNLNAQVNQGQYQTGQITNTQANAENLASTRAAELGTNQQATNEFNEQQGFNQNMALNQAVSNRYGTLAQGQAGLTAQQGGQANTAGNQELGAVANENSAYANMADTYAGSMNTQNAQAPLNQLESGLAMGLGSAVAGAAGGGFSARGSFITKPVQFTTRDGSRGIAGEAGPEAIVPLNNPEPMIHKIRQVRAKMQPMVPQATVPGGPQMPLPPTKYATGGMIAPISNMQPMAPPDTAQAMFRPTPAMPMRPAMPGQGATQPNPASPMPAPTSFGWTGANSQPQPQQPQMPMSPAMPAQRFADGGFTPGITSLDPADDSWDYSGSTGAPNPTGANPSYNTGVINPGATPAPTPGAMPNSGVTFGQAMTRGMRPGGGGLLGAAIGYGMNKLMPNSQGPSDSSIASAMNSGMDRTLATEPTSMSPPPASPASTSADYGSNSDDESLGMFANGGVTPSPVSTTQPLIGGGQDYSVNQLRSRLQSDPALSMYLAPNAAQAVPQYASGGILRRPISSMARIPRATPMGGAAPIGRAPMTTPAARLAPARPPQPLANPMPLGRQLMRYRSASSPMARLQQPMVPKIGAIRSPQNISPKVRVPGIVRNAGPAIAPVGA